MPHVNGRWVEQPVILFTHGELSYELIKDLEPTTPGESKALAWERTPEKRLRQVIVRSLPPASPSTSVHDRIRARLDEEARLATYLQHPNVARVFGRYEVQGVLHVVSEVLEGASLNTLISASFMRKVRLSPAFCLYVGAEVASALHHAHTRTDEKGSPLGIVHRDVSPLRIYLGTEGEVFLTDFAVARSLLPGRVTTTVPHPHGEVFYASPEALLGDEMDGRSDLFSLGLVLLEMATWSHLYNMANARAEDLEAVLSEAVKNQVLVAAASAAVAKLPDHAEDCILRAATFTPHEVEEVTQFLIPPVRSAIRGLLQRKPEDRYPSAAALEADLRAGLASLGAPYGAVEAIREIRTSLEEASASRQQLDATSEEHLPPRVMTQDDFITAPGDS
jgi:serine/threonine protein kinase